MDPKGFIRVNFSTRGFAKLVDENALSPVTPSPQAVVQVGRILAANKLTEAPAKVFKSIPEFRGLDYVGYIIDKERLDKSNGTWKRLNEFQVIGAKSNSYKDSRVAYGETYRYRIRAVAKWTTFNNPDAQNNTQQLLDQLTYIKQAIASALTVNNNLLTLQTSPYYKALVFPESNNASNTSNVFKLPNDVVINGNSLNNYFSFALGQNTSNSRLRTLDSSVQNFTNVLAANKNVTSDKIISYLNSLTTLGLSIPFPDKKYVSEYLVSFPERKWQYVTVAEHKLPEPPSAIKIIPSTPNKAISLYWLTPANDQRDISYIRLYRREKLGEQWQLIQDHMSLTLGHYVDKKVSLGQTYVYALSTVDVHGYESFLSAQTEAQLNSSFNTEKKEKLLRWVSGAGARPDERDTVFKRFYDPFEQIIAYHNLKVSVSDVYAEDNTSITIKVKSLDTHEVRHIRLLLKNVST